MASIATIRRVVHETRLRALTITTARLDWNKVGEEGNWLWNGSLGNNRTIELVRPDGSVLPNAIDIVVYRLVNGTAGDRLQYINMPLDCKEPQICSQSHGGFTFVRYGNDEQGIVNCTNPASVEYFVGLVISFDMKGEEFFEIVSATIFNNSALAPVQDLGPTGFLPHVVGDVEIRWEYVIVARTPSSRSCEGTGTVTFMVPRRETGALTCPPVTYPAVSPAQVPDRW